MCVQRLGIVSEGSGTGVKLNILFMLDSARRPVLNGIIALQDGSQIAFGRGSGLAHHRKLRCSAISLLIIILHRSDRYHVVPHE